MTERRAYTIAAFLVFAWSQLWCQEMMLYELVKGSRLIHTSRDEEGKPIQVVTELRGAFRVAFLDRSEFSIDFRMSDIEFEEVSGPEHTVTGGGGQNVQFFGSCRTPLSGAQTGGLTLSIDDMEAILLQTFPSFLSRSLPVIAFRASEVSDVLPFPDEWFSIEIVAIPQAENAKKFFLRGDVDGDGRRNITDAVGILRYLFSGGQDPTCADAADCDDDGAVEITDALCILNHLFRGAEFPGLRRCFCSLDTTEDILGCGGQESCHGEGV